MPTTETIFQVGGAALSIVGNLFVVSRKRERRAAGFLIWCVANPLLLVFYALTGAYALIVMTTYFMVLAILGFRNNSDTKDGAREVSNE